MTASDLLAHLQACGARLRVDGEMVEVRTSRGTLTDGLRALLRERKADLLHLLSQESPAAPDTPAATSCGAAAAPSAPLSAEALEVAHRWEEVRDARAELSAHVAGCALPPAKRCDERALHYCPAGLAILHRRFDAYAAALAVLGAVGIRATAPDDPCPCCGSSSWWLGWHGAVTCATCHPPAPGAARWRLVPWEEAAGSGA